MKRSALSTYAFLSLLWFGLGSALLSPILFPAAAWASGGAQSKNPNVPKDVIRFQIISQTFDQGNIDGLRSLVIELVFKDSDLRSEFLEILPKIHETFNQTLYGSLTQRTPINTIRKSLSDSLKPLFGEQKLQNVECVVTENTDAQGKGGNDSSNPKGGAKNESKAEGKPKGEGGGSKH
ncbi:hypothetical protein CCP2SC5_950002 [Azospirillaceae bacterium]